jgi:translation initiation factor 2B subunit (eIF-2B alpha/beta/delta family)
MNLKKEISKIKSISSNQPLKIAEKSILFLSKSIENSKTSTELLFNLKEIKNKILNEISIQPITTNALDYLAFELKKTNFLELKTLLQERIKKALRHINNSGELISEVGQHKIKKGMVIFVFSYSPTTMSILLKAKQNKLNFIVNTLESNKNKDGKLISSILAKNKIPVKYYSDVALRQALKGADLVLLGTDLITQEGVLYSKIGSELVAELAEKYELPTYVCADSWVCNSHISKQFEKIQMKQQTSNSIKIMDYSFEKIHPKLITGIISGLGIYKTTAFINEVKNKYPWI